ncbi:MAG: hypothetical protein GYA51_15290 [Candidatus Methanofastidiosa archaeon]|nr:hypothetical protein [Candidatus Methanofastidiosa archaeon]
MVVCRPIIVKQPRWAVAVTRPATATDGCINCRTTFTQYLHVFPPFALVEVLAPPNT